MYILIQKSLLWETYITYPILLFSRAIFISDLITHHLLLYPMYQGDTNWYRIITKSFDFHVQNIHLKITFLNIWINSKSSATYYIIYITCIYKNNHVEPTTPQYIPKIQESSLLSEKMMKKTSLLTNLSMMKTFFLKYTICVVFTPFQENGLFII